MFFYLFVLQMPNCSLLGCSGRSGKRFPEDPELREKWLEKINRTDFEPTPNALVCYKHFRTSDFVPDTENKDKSGRKRKKKRLKPTAIPSYFLSPTEDPLQGNLLRGIDNKTVRRLEISSYTYVLF